QRRRTCRYRSSVQTLMSTARPVDTEAGAAQSFGPTILLVEDERSIGTLVRGYLERAGYRLIWVRTGEDALIELARHPVRMVVLDIGLPGMDGFDVCRRIRSGSSVPIVMLTARDEEPDRVAGLEVGADDYVSKPFSPRELAARINAVLRRTEERPGDESPEPGDLEVRGAGYKAARGWAGSTRCGRASSRRRSSRSFSRSASASRSAPC